MTEIHEQPDSNPMQDTRVFQEYSQTELKQKSKHILSLKKSSIFQSHEKDENSVDY